MICPKCYSLVRKKSDVFTCSVCKREFTEGYLEDHWALVRHKGGVKMSIKYKVGDEVKVRSDLIPGKVYGEYSFIKDMLQYCGLKDTIKELMAEGYVLYSTQRYVFTDEMLEPVHPIGKTFSVLNESEAEQYIEKVVEFADSRGVRTDQWRSGILRSVRKEGIFPFRIGSSDQAFIRTCKETFEPEQDKGFIEALKKSIQQWRIMYDTGKSKEEVYRFLGGCSDRRYCFLCDYIRPNKNKCKECLFWGSDSRSFRRSFQCEFSPNSVYRKWRDESSPENTLAVLNYLKEELSKLI